MEDPLIASDIVLPFLPGWKLSRSQDFWWRGSSGATFEMTRQRNKGGENEERLLQQKLSSEINSRVCAMRVYFCLPRQVVSSKSELDRQNLLTRPDQLTEQGAKIWMEKVKWSPVQDDTATKQSGEKEEWLLLHKMSSEINSRGCAMPGLFLSAASGCFIEKEWFVDETYRPDPTSRQTYTTEMKTFLNRLVLDHDWLMD